MAEDEVRGAFDVAFVKDVRSLISQQGILIPQKLTPIIPLLIPLRAQRDGLYATTPRILNIDVINFKVRSVSPQCSRGVIVTCYVSAEGVYEGNLVLVVILVVGGVPVYRDFGFDGVGDVDLAIVGPRLDEDREGGGGGGGDRVYCRLEVGVLSAGFCDYDRSGWW